MRGAALAVLVWLSLLCWLSGCGGHKTTIGLTVRPDDHSGSVTVTVEPAGTTNKPQDSDADLLDSNLGEIYFDFDSAFLGPESKPVLLHHARLLVKNSEMQLRLDGHCDERGTEEYNLALGERRARATKDYLLRYGISSMRVSIRSYGEEQPVDRRHTEESWAANRRVEFHQEWGN